MENDTVAGGHNDVMGGSKAAPLAQMLRALGLFAEMAEWPQAPRNEHREWPEALLAIGTFGIKDMKQDPPQIAENLDASEDLPDFTVEEVNTLQKELAKLLSRKPKCSTRGSQIAEEEEEEEEEEEGGGGRANLPLNRFLNCPSSLEVDRTTSLKLDNRGDLSPYTKVMLSKAKDALLGNRNAVKKKSLSFLLKKIFVCGSGFEPPPSFRDPIPEPRIEKISFWRSRNQYGQQSVDVYEGSHGREDSPTQMGFGRYAKNCLGVEGILPSTETSLTCTHSQTDGGAEQRSRRFLQEVEEEKKKKKEKH
ncbi:hypothetical protein GW17_00019501 [Ensete ventricosum]|nr:hypothetical protein GW17_00019501 [Ensete ventricosum]